MNEYIPNLLELQILRNILLGKTCNYIYIYIILLSENKFNIPTQKRGLPYEEDLKWKMKFSECQQLSVPF